MSNTHAERELYSLFDLTNGILPRIMAKQQTPFPQTFTVVLLDGPRMVRDSRSLPVGLPALGMSMEHLGAICHGPIPYSRDPDQREEALAIGVHEKSGMRVAIWLPHTWNLWVDLADRPTATEDARHVHGIIGGANGVISWAVETRVATSSDFADSKMWLRVQFCNKTRLDAAVQHVKRTSTSQCVTDLNMMVPSVRPCSRVHLSGFEIVPVEEKRTWTMAELRGMDDTARVIEVPSTVHSAAPNLPSRTRVATLEWMHNARSMSVCVRSLDEEVHYATFFFKLDAVVGGNACGSGSDTQKITSWFYPRTQGEVVQAVRRILVALDVAVVQGAGLLYVADCIKASTNCLVRQWWLEDVVGMQCPEWTRRVQLVAEDLEQSKALLVESFNRNVHALREAYPRLGVPAPETGCTTKHLLRILAHCGPPLMDGPEVFFSEGEPMSHSLWVFKAFVRACDTALQQRTLPAFRNALFCPEVVGDGCMFDVICRPTPLEPRPASVSSVFGELVGDVICQAVGLHVMLPRPPNSPPTVLCAFRWEDRALAWDTRVHLNTVRFGSSMALTTHVFTTWALRHGGLPIMTRPTVEAGTAAAAFHTYTGGLCLDLVEGVHRDVVILDVKSLYPSVVLAFNLSPENVRVGATASAVAAAADLPAAPDTRTFSFKELTGKAKGPSVTVSKLRPRSVSSTTLGLLPSCLHFLVARRRQFETRNPLFAKVLKMVANALCGSFGSPFSTVSCRPLAAIITCLGREVLKTMVCTLERMKWCKVVGGDTDSVFVSGVLPGVAGMVANNVSTALRSGIDVSVDATCRTFVLCGKKSYAYLPSGATGQSVASEVLVGLPDCSKDVPLVVRVSFRRLARLLLNNQCPSEDELIGFFRGAFADLRGAVDRRDLPALQRVQTVHPKSTDSSSRAAKALHNTIARSPTAAVPVLPAAVGFVETPDLLPLCTDFLASEEGRGIAIDGRAMEDIMCAKLEIALQMFRCEKGLRLLRDTLLCVRREVTATRQRGLKRARAQARASGAGEGATKVVSV